jgi:hypothetical protein
MRGTTFIISMAAAQIILANTAFAFDCDEDWRDDYAVIVQGEASASIRHQCRDNETPCPPHTELKRRATEAARTLALANAQARYASSSYSESSVTSGQVTQFSSTASAGDIYDIDQCVYVDGDEVTVRIIGEK